MSSSEASNAVSMTLKGGTDPCWEYGERVFEKSTNSVRCKFCKQVFSAGISRLKQHLAGIKGNCKECKLVPEDVKKKVKEIYLKFQAKKEAKNASMQALLDDVHVGEEDEYDETMELEEGHSSQSNVFRSMKPKCKGPMDGFATRTPEELTNIAKSVKQNVLNPKAKKKAREDVVKYIARWFYEAGIPFHTATLPSFQQMMQAIGKYGVGMEAPTPYELSETFLQKEVEETKENLKGFKESCAISGCTLMTDAWSDRKHRSIMNIVVHCPAGIAFLFSQDASAEKHDGTYIYNFVDKAIEDAGEENVVQIVTDNASNNMAAASMLKLKRPNIFWTSCAAHTVNLMVGDIAKVKPIRNAILMARNVTVYIYNHTITLSIMREFTGGEIVRPGATRFATAYLSLHSMREKRKELKQMFTSTKWMNHPLSNKDAGKKVAEIIGSNKFWDNVDLSLKCFSPLVKVLRRVDGDKPSMGFLYGDLDNAKEEIARNLNHEEKKVIPIWKLIDTRWNDKLKGPLHRAGYYLNPYFYYEKKEATEKAGIFMNGFVECMHMFYPNDPEKVEKIGEQMAMYQHQRGSFGRDLAKNGAKNPNLNPVNWWNFYGTDTPELKEMAMRILNLTTSSSGCERNWSTFEMIHTKKRNRLSHKKLRDLVFVKFNARLRNKLALKNRDPLSAYDDEERVTDWLVPPKQNGEPHIDSDDEVFPGEGLSWRQVAKSMGANPKRKKSVRIKTYKRGKENKRASSSKENSKELTREKDEEEFSSMESSSEEELNIDIPLEDDSSNSEHGEA